MSSRRRKRKFAALMEEMILNKTSPESRQSVQNVEPLEQDTSCNDGQKTQKPNECAEDCAWQGDKTGLCNFVPGLPTLGKSC